MKKKIFIPMLLTILLVSNAYSNSNMPAPPSTKQVETAPPSEDSICCQWLLNKHVLPSEFRNMYSEMDLGEFCKQFPCMCCTCDGDKKLKPDNEPCPKDYMFKKLCCKGTPFPYEVEWRCCKEEEEPPCDCCNDD